MTNTPPPTQRTITTEAELQALVAKALTTGVLDISHCVIEVPFNLPALLEQCGQPEICSVVLDGKEMGCKKRICPFELKAFNTVFKPLPTSTISIDFGAITFKKKVRFDSAVFEQSTNFQFVTFEDKAYFNSATFGIENSTHFNSAIFEKEVYFNSAKFGSSVYFDSAWFEKKTEFNSAWFDGAVSFLSAKFRGWAVFRTATFNDIARFQYATFKQLVNFDFVTFKLEASFYSATFGDDASFENAELMKNVYFSGVDFQQTPNFIGLMFKENASILFDYKKCSRQLSLHLKNIECDGDAVRLKIKNLHETSNAKILFENCCFYGKNVAFTNVAMHNVRIDAGNTVKGMLFDHCDFDTTNPSEWQLQHLHFRSLAGEDQWLNSTDPEKLKERALVYASLKTTATEGGETQLANDFHFWQQYYQGKLEKSWFCWNWLYKITSAYGLDVRLPVLWFIGVLITFACVYALLLKPIVPTTFAFLCSYISLLLALIDYNIHQPLRKLGVLSLISVCIFSVGLVVLIGLEGLLLKGFPLSVSGSFPFIFADNEKTKHLLSLISTESGSVWATGIFYLVYIVQHLMQGFLLFQIGAAIRNKVKR
jgi:hypothetical protein